MIGTSSLVAVMWGVINRRYRTRQAAETEAHRIALYRQYLSETEATLLDRLYSRFHGSKTLLFISHRDAISARADAILRV